MGSLGSLHCIGMCGPLALSLPVVSNGHFAKFKGAFLYNLGRVFTYAALGILLGSIGNTFAAMGFQQVLSITLGLLIIVVLCLPKGLWIKKTNKFTQNLFARWRATLASLFERRNYRSLFFIGLVNGLLPCGLVYMAAAGAVATGSIVKGSLFMAAFGFGTFPLMWSLTFFGSLINIQSRAKIRKAYPYLMFLMACFLIIRGIGPGGIQGTSAQHVQGDSTAKNKKINCYNLNVNANANP